MTHGRGWRNRFRWGRGPRCGCPAGQNLAGFGAAGEAKMNGRDAELPLSECRTADEVEVCDVSSDSAVAVRLRELGMVQGASLRIVRDGSPMIIELGNTRFCLRGNEAALVRVRLLPPCDVAGTVFSTDNLS